MNQAKNDQPSLPIGIEDIKKVLPHRYPFLLVDRIVELSDTRVVGVKCVTSDEPFFNGHFPGKAVMPGVLMIEALAQAGGYMMLHKPENRGRLAFLVAVNNARFRRVVVPGDRLFLEVELVKAKARIGVVKCVAKVDGETACEAEIMYSLGE